MKVFDPFMCGVLVGIMVCGALMSFGARLARWNDQHVALKTACEQKGGRIIGDGFWGAEHCFAVTP